MRILQRGMVEVHPQLAGIPIAGELPTLFQIAGLAVVTVDDARLALDLDLPEDLVLWRGAA